MKTTHVLKLNCGITCTLHFDEETADMDALGTQGATESTADRVFLPLPL
jgi:hypothetical protein